MATGTGLDGQVGIVIESAWDTAGTVDKFPQIESETIENKPAWIEPTALQSGVYGKRASQLVNSRTEIQGGFVLPFQTRLMGTLLKAAMLSSETTPTLLTDGYQQIHSMGATMGTSLTVQVGRPQPSDGTVEPHTYSGLMVTDWEFSVADNAEAKFTVNFDGAQETTATALASASYLSTAIFNFAQSTSITLGGTVSGTPLAVTGGTAVTSVVKSLSIKGTNPLNVDRYGLGNSGVKNQQKLNNFQTVTITMDVEYLKSEWYDPFIAGTSQPFYCIFEGGATVTSGTDLNTISFLAPAATIKAAPFHVSGPDLVTGSVEMEAYIDASSNPLLQAVYISADTAAV